MRKYGTRIAVAIIGVAAVRFFTDSAPIDDVPPNHTGKVDLTCTGLNYEITGKSGNTAKDINWESAQSLTPTILTLEFEKGQMIGWEATIDPNKRSEDYQHISQLVSIFERTCPNHKSACAVTQQKSKNYELYGIKSYEVTTQGDLEAKGGVGILTQNLADFSSYYRTNGKTYTDMMSCEIRKSPALDAS